MIFEVKATIQEVTFNALVCWALLSFLLDNYEIVRKIVKNPKIRTRILCPKCFAFWFTLLMTFNVFVALASSFLVNVYFCHIKNGEL